MRWTVRGQATVEFALSALLVLTVVLGVIDLGGGALASTALSNPAGTRT